MPPDVSNLDRWRARAVALHTLRNRVELFVTDCVDAGWRDGLPGATDILAGMQVDDAIANVARQLDKVNDRLRGS